MATYKVQCVTIDYGSPYDDCRCIEAVGFPAESGGFARLTPEQVYDLVEHEGETVVVEYKGTQRELEGATDGTRKYVRTEPEDTSEDTLLKKPSC